jgi:hypothetical protein
LVHYRHLLCGLRYLRGCRRGEQTYTTGWLKLGPIGHWRIRGGMMHRSVHTEDTANTWELQWCYPGFGPS